VTSSPTINPSQAWANPVTITSASTNAGTAIAVSNGTAFLAYLGIDNKVYCEGYTSGSWNPLTNPSVSGTSSGLGVGIYNGYPSIGFNASTSGDDVLAYSGSSWSQLSAGYVPNSSNSGACAYAMDNSGNSYMAFAVGAAVYVEEYTGGSWTGGKIGTDSNGSVSQISLTVDTNGTPYVGWVDTAGYLYTSEDVSGSWTTPTMPNSGISAQYLSLFASNGNLFMAFVGRSDFYIYTMQYSGGSWSSPLKSNYYTQATVALSVFNGNPYFAFSDGANGGTLSVAGYNGSWSDLGSTGLTPSQLSSLAPGFCIDGNGNMYVSYTYYGSSQIVVSEYH
jgi:hypothetical protein